MAQKTAFYRRRVEQDSNKSPENGLYFGFTVFRKIGWLECFMFVVNRIYLYDTLKHINIDLLIKIQMTNKSKNFIFIFLYNIFIKNILEQL
jgi:hypothetical protein